MTEPACKMILSLLCYFAVPVEFSIDESCYDKDCNNNFTVSDSCKVHGNALQHGKIRNDQIQKFMLEFPEKDNLVWFLDSLGARIRFCRNKETVEIAMVTREGEQILAVSLFMSSLALFINNLHITGNILHERFSVNLSTCDVGNLA